MKSAEALQRARVAGVEIALDGDDLVLEASSPPPEPVLDALSRNKAGIVALLRPGDDGWSADDWQVYFDERAGIAEFDGGFSRPEAEAMAFACCVSEWMNRNPATSSPEHCLACGAGDRPGDPLLPHGTATQGHAWLHSGCWPDWHESRKGEAIAALAKIRTEERSILPWPGRNPPRATS